MLVVKGSDFKKEVLESKIPVLVDFFAEWCPPCRMYGPGFEKVAAAFEGKVKFVKLNIDDSEAIATEYGVMSIPTTILFKKGKPAANFVGAKGEPQLAAWVKSNI